MQYTGPVVIAGGIDSLNAFVVRTVIGCLALVPGFVCMPMCFDPGVRYAFQGPGSPFVIIVAMIVAILFAFGPGAIILAWPAIARRIPALRLHLVVMPHEVRLQRGLKVIDRAPRVVDGQDVLRVTELSWGTRIDVPPFRQGAGRPLVVRGCRAGREALVRAIRERRPAMAGATEGGG